MNLESAVQKLGPKKVTGELPDAVTDITADSREVEEGWAFVALSGGSVDGHEFVGRAFSAGARVAFVEREVPCPDGKAVVRLKSTRHALPSLSRLAYGEPTRELQVVGVTGTNGKTTTTWLIESLARSLGISLGVIGTISHRWDGYEEPAVNTTPGVLKLARMFRRMVEAGVKIAAVEVSSHGLALGRLDGVFFDVGIWTTLSRDHLDFHGSMEAYRDAKTRFFSRLLPTSRRLGKKDPVAVVNAEDRTVRAVFTRELIESLRGRCVFFGLDDVLPPAGDHLVASAQQHETGWVGTLVESSRTVPFEFPLIGRFNLLNALGAVGAMQALGYPLVDVARALGEVRSVPGRMELLGGGTHPRVFVDYAHTPDALARAIETVRQTTPGDVWVVFGCGGDRDATKRPEMGRVVADLADRIVITNDNPRNEKPTAIADDILAGVPGGEQAVHVELDRRKAIAHAVQQAEARDVVLVAGKGHETYQIIGEERLALDDRELVKSALAGRSGEAA